MKHLPMIEYAASFFNENDLADCYVIGVQHLLPTTLSMFEALSEKGLKKENISLLGKNYSTDPEVFRIMREKGYDVCERSIAFDSHSAFDDQFQSNIAAFLSERAAKLNSPQFKKIIILDDGGEFLAQVENYLNRFDHVFGMEQTSSGYNKLQGRPFPFPIINMASSKIKLDFEAPRIIQECIEKIEEFLDREQIQVNNVLILGNGAMGAKLYETLTPRYEVTRFDVLSHRSDLELHELSNNLNAYDLIIGCSGATSLPESQHRFLKQGAVLVSLSSSDREFDAIHLRKQAPQTNCYLDPIRSNGVVLMNCGFAINFNGKNVDDPEFFQLVRSIIIACIYQGLKNKHSSGFVDLDEELQSGLAERFLEVNESKKTRP